MNCSNHSEFWCRVTTSTKIIPPEAPSSQKVSRYPLTTPHFADPLFGALRILAGTGSGFAPVGSPLSGTRGYQTLRHCGIDGEIARDNNWLTVVPVRVRPTAGGCAVTRNHHFLPTPFSGHLDFWLVPAEVLPVDARAHVLALF